MSTDTLQQPLTLVISVLLAGVAVGPPFPCNISTGKAAGESPAGIDVVFLSEVVEDVAAGILWRADL